MSVVKSLYSLSLQKAYRYFADRNRLRRSQYLIKRYLQETPVRKLQIGSGGNCFEGWLNTDLIRDNKSMAIIDATEKFPLPDNSFHLVYSEHLFEHLDIAGQLNYLRECRRILVPGGKIRIATPDFDFLSGLLKPNLSELQKKHLQFNADNFLSHVPKELLNGHLPVYVVNNYMRDWGHQMIHNKSSKRRLLEYCGFKQINFVQVGKSSEPDFDGIERHWNQIGHDLNELETMVVEAVS